MGGGIALLVPYGRSSGIAKLGTGVASVVFSLASVGDIQNKRLVATFDDNIELQLESLEDIRKREVEQQRLRQEQERIAEINRKEQERITEIALKEEEARIAERNKKIAPFIKQFKNLPRNWKEGDRICLVDVDCYATSAAYERNDCFKISAFVEKSNADKTKYQVRIEEIYQRVTYLDASGTKYATFDGVTYRLGEIKWISPAESKHWSWITCER